MAGWTGGTPGEAPFGHIIHQLGWNVCKAWLKGSGIRGYSTVVTLQLQIALGSSGGNLLAMLQCCFWDGIGSTILGWGLTGVESGSSKSGKIEMV